jgi:hypothetical protein
VNTLNYTDPRFRKKLLFNKLYKYMSTTITGIDFTFPKKYQPLVEELIHEQGWYCNSIEDFEGKIHHRWVCTSKFPFFTKVVSRVECLLRSVYFLDDLEGLDSLTFCTYSVCRTKEALLEREAER